MDGKLYGIHTRESDDNFKLFKVFSNNLDYEIVLVINWYLQLFVFPNSGSSSTTLRNAKIISTQWRDNICITFSFNNMLLFIIILRCIYFFFFEIFLILIDTT